MHKRVISNKIKCKIERKLGSTQKSGKFFCDDNFLFYFIFHVAVICHMSHAITILCPSVEMVESQSTFSLLN